MSLPLSKSQLRKQLLIQRQSLAQATWRTKSDRLCENLANLGVFQEAKIILAYFSIHQEPDLSPLFTSKHQWGFPRCVGKSLVWHSWQQGDRLETGKYGIPEPHSHAPILKPSQVDLLLIPAVACDYQGYRLGYGGGFYDRLLSHPQWQSLSTVGIVFDFAHVPQLPTEPWDLPLQQVCTDIPILKC